ncbi:MAG: serine--tRNA ligase, partial [Clostridiales Family XIII bacterium]|nr:serine--tRNA ligase [Clostridiales Family XIII bacterium]
MLDRKRIREDYDAVKVAVDSRGRGDFGLPRVKALEAERRELLSEVEKLKSRQNTASKAIPGLKKEGRDASALLAELKALSEEIKTKDGLAAATEENLRNALLQVPNVPDPEVPVGSDERDNREIRKVGAPRTFAFEEKAHWDIGTDLGILDFERAAKISGARFAVNKGLGARLEREVIRFMLSLHTEQNGYTEILPPFLVNRDAMIGTGQLPKFEEDMFHIASKDFFLIPTAEVPLTNLHRDEILDGDELPIRYVAYTPCFRKEAGSAGRDTRGLIRVHQFNKVELVKFTKPEDSRAELESLLAAAE